MKHIKYSLLIFMLITTMLFSCQKLIEKPLSFVQPADFYNTPAQIEAAFAASMNSLWSNWAAYQYPGIHYFENDDQLTGGNLVIPNNYAADIWRRHYNAILNLNSAIAAMKKGNLGSNVSKHDYDVLMAQATFLRGWNYFMLVRLWGDIPLILDDTPDPTQNPPKRTAVAQVYDLIIKDLTEASENLPRKWGDDKLTRPTRGAALGTLAKVYLTMATAPLNQTANYAKAAAAAKTVIDEKDYILIHDIDKVFTIETRYGPEVMFTFTTNYADQPMNAQSWYPPVLDGWGDFQVQSQWAEQIPETARKKAYILTEINGKKYTEWAGSSNPFVKKYMYDKPEDFNAYRSLVVTPILRFADVLLIYAEAANMANGSPTPDAVAALNQVIDRANGYVANVNHPLATTAMSKTDFDVKVIEERNQELCFELGDRWFDLVRKRILKEKSLPFIQQNFTEDDYLYPIPDNDIRLNPNLTQNPGYSKPQ